MDLRPILSDNLYPKYIDGQGWSDTGSRDDGYCPVCNTKNFDLWLQRLATQRHENEIQEAKKRDELDAKKIQETKDKFRAASISVSLMIE
jgi:hypothetical protein